MALKKLMTGLTMTQSLKIYEELIGTNNEEAMRRQCREDLFYLLVIACKRRDLIHPWLYDRVREVEIDPDGHIDLWPREFYKSTILNFGMNIQDILVDPEETTGIFSYTRPIAKAFLEQIKRELEINTYLKNLFPDILYADPEKESPKWSLDDGIMVKRQSNPKEKTIEAWGLVDSQPTSKHFSKLVYDDVVTMLSVSTPDMIEKTSMSFWMSGNLGADRDDRPCRRRIIGTRYHMSDTYKEIIEREEAIPRIYYPTDLGREDIDVLGNPVFRSLKWLRKKRKGGPYIYGSQMLQNPVADRVMGFKSAWLNYYNILQNHMKWNFYLIVDPSSGKKKSDFSVFLVIALAPDNNYYLVDGCRDRLNLTERCEKLFYFHRKWPIKKTGYEQYGMQADIEHIKFRQEQEGYRFHIEPLAGSVTKEDRIRKLVPVYEQGRFWLPHRILYKTKDGRLCDLVAEHNQEYTDFPVSAHDDILDTEARIVDDALGAVFPKLEATMMPSMTHSFKGKKYNVLEGNTQGHKII